MDSTILLRGGVAHVLLGPPRGTNCNGHVKNAAGDPLLLLMDRGPILTRVMAAMVDALASGKGPFRL